MFSKRCNNGAVQDVTQRGVLQFVHLLLRRDLYEDLGTKSVFKMSWKKAQYGGLRVSLQGNTKMRTPCSRVLIGQLILN